ncbi:hypothetical protein ACS0TY_028576 [Phlomoides rotata]
MDPSRPEPVTYVCGGCGHENTMRQVDAQVEASSIIRCCECGYRVLYKKRTRRIVQHVAR